MSACQPDDGAMVVCLRGTLGCTADHAEPTLLERLNEAEGDLRQAQDMLERTFEIGYPVLVERAMVIVNAASARCMAAAARCLVSVGQGP